MYTVFKQQKNNQQVENNHIWEKGLSYWTTMYKIYIGFKIRPVELECEKSLTMFTFYDTHTGEEKQQ